MINNIDNKEFTYIIIKEILYFMSYYLNENRDSSRISSTQLSSSSSSSLLLLNWAGLHLHLHYVALRWV
jgi:hypothetical protein